MNFIIGKEHMIYIKKIQKQLKTKDLLHKQTHQYREIDINKWLLNSLEIVIEFIIKSIMIVQQQEITKNNNHLFDHLTSISTRPIKQDYYNFDPDLPTNLNYPYRKEQALEISEQNKKMARRIVQQGSSIKVQEFCAEYEQTKQIKKRLERIKNQFSYIQKIRNKSTETAKTNKNSVRLQPLNQSRQQRILFSDNSQQHQRNVNISSFSSHENNYTAYGDIYLTALKEEDIEESLDQLAKKNKQIDDNERQNSQINDNNNSHNSHNSHVNEEDQYYQMDEDFQKEEKDNSVTKPKHQSSSQLQYEPDFEQE